MPAPDHPRACQQGVRDAFGMHPLVGQEHQLLAQGAAVRQDQHMVAQPQRGVRPAAGQVMPGKTHHRDAGQDATSTVQPAPMRPR
jgi:hypothetical protein